MTNVMGFRLTYFAVSPKQFGQMKNVTYLVIVFGWVPRISWLMKLASLFLICRMVTTAFPFIHCRIMNGQANKCHNVINLTEELSVATAAMFDEIHAKITEMSKSYTFSQFNVNISNL